MVLSCIVINGCMVSTDNHRIYPAFIIETVKTRMDQQIIGQGVSVSKMKC